MEDRVMPISILIGFRTLALALTHLLTLTPQPINSAANRRLPTTLDKLNAARHLRRFPSNQAIARGSRKLIVFKKRTNVRANCSDQLARQGATVFRLHRGR